MDDLENINELIKEYETVLPAINEQLQFYKGEHGTLKKEIINLTKENKSLSNKLEECFSTHMEFDPFKYKENDLIENLKCQLDLSLKEKESVVELWRTSMTRIDYLERELKVYSASTDNSSRNLVKKLKKTYENELKTIKDQLRISNDKLKVTLNASKTSLDSKQDELEATNKNLSDANEKLDKLHDELDRLRAQTVALEDANRNLQVQINGKNETIDNLKIDAYQAKLKVAEACHVIEAALIEKDAALTREKDALEEIKKLSTTLSELVLETENKVKMEVQSFRGDYEDKIAKLKMEMKQKQNEMDSKDADLEKLQEKCQYLEQELEEVKKSKAKHLKNTSLEKNKYLNKYQEASQKLLIMEHKNVQMKQEHQQTNCKLQSLKRFHESEMSNKEFLCKKLQSQVATLETDLNLSKSNFLKVSNKLDDLTRKISVIDAKYKEEFELKQTESEQLVSKRVNELENERTRMIKDLKNRLEDQTKLNQKWKFEVKQVTEKLEERIKTLKSEMSYLKTKNNELLLELQSSERKRLQYKENLKNLCTEFNALTKNST